MARSMPRVTVLMPVYNGEPYIGQSIRSILDQTYTDFEFLIIDDGSTDTSIQTIQSFNDPRIRLVQNEHNLGQTATLNRGLELARGEFVARIDQDDLSHPSRLAEQVSYLDNHPNITLVSAQTTAINSNGDTVFAFNYPEEHAKLHWLLLTECPIFHSSVVFRRDSVKNNFGGYNSTFSYCQDYELWSRIAFKSQIANLPIVLNYWRVHPEATSSNLKGSLVEQEPHTTSYNNIKRLGLSIDEGKWREIRGVYSLGEFPKSDSVLIETIDSIYYLGDLFVKRYHLAENAKNQLRLWLIDDITKRFLMSFNKYGRQPELVNRRKGFLRLVHHNKRAIVLGRSLFTELSVGGKNLGRIRKAKQFMIGES